MGIRRRYLVAALLALVVGLAELAASQTSQERKLDFALPPNKFEHITFMANPTDTVSGHFQETSGQPVSFLIMTSLEYGLFRNGTALEYVYIIPGKRSGTIAYTFKSEDNYSLIFRHASGYFDTNETIDFNLTYTIHDSRKFLASAFFLALAVMGIGYALHSGQSSDEAEQKQHLKPLPSSPKGFSS